MSFKNAVSIESQSYCLAIDIALLELAMEQLVGEVALQYNSSTEHCNEPATSYAWWQEKKKEQLDQL